MVELTPDSSADMAAGAAARALFRTSRVLRAVATPCYIPPGIMGNVPHLTPGAWRRLINLVRLVAVLMVSLVW